MVTQAEEQQAAEFLKRAEIRTMRKDLLALREGDSLKERDKIAKIRTIEEQQAEKEKIIQEQAASQAKKIGITEVLQQNQTQERLAEKDLKEYATEQERQQIFLYESQRLGFEKQIDTIDKEKDPTLRLDKNKLLLQKREQQTKLTSITEQENKIEGEQKVVAEKSQTTTIPAEKKSLEQRRADLDKEVQEIEKKRWEAEKQIETTDTKVAEIDKALEQLVIEKNNLRDKALGIDKSLREIYSIVIARVEEKRRGETSAQLAQKEITAKTRAEEKEKIQKQQWTGGAPQKQTKYGEFLNNAPAPTRNKLAKSFEEEETQRAKFLQHVETLSQEKDKQPSVSQPVVPPPAPMPPVPSRKK